MREYDPKITQKSKYLKPGWTFPPQAPPEKAAASAGVLSLIHQMGEHVAHLQTTHTIRPIYAHPNYFRQSSLANMETSLEWLRGHIGNTMLLSFDIEFVPRTKIPFLVLLGTLHKRTLTIDVRSYRPESGESPLPPPLIDFLRDYILVGAAIKDDVKEAKLEASSYLDVLELSRSITLHPFCPWRSLFPEVYLSNRTSLKHVPELLYSEWYGTLTQNDFIKRRSSYPLEHIKEWPASRTPLKLYAWKFPVRGTQLAYCRNDSMAPFIHFYVLCILEMLNDKLFVPDDEAEAKCMEEDLLLASIAHKIHKAENPPTKVKEALERACVMRKDPVPFHVDYPDLVPAGYEEERAKEEGWPVIEDLLETDGTELQELEDAELLSTDREDVTAKQRKEAIKRQKSAAEASCKKYRTEVQKPSEPTKIIEKRDRSRSERRSDSKAETSVKAVTDTPKRDQGTKAAASPKSLKTGNPRTSTPRTHQERESRDRTRVKKIESRDSERSRSRRSERRLLEEEQDRALEVLRKLRENPKPPSRSELDRRLDKRVPVTKLVPVKMREGEKVEGWMGNMRKEWLRTPSSTSESDSSSEEPSLVGGAVPKSVVFKPKQTPDKNDKHTHPTYSNVVKPRVEPSASITSETLRARERESRLTRPSAFLRLGPPPIAPFPKPITVKATPPPAKLSIPDYSALMEDSGVIVDSSQSSTLLSEVSLPKPATPFSCAVEITAPFPKTTTPLLYRR